MIMLSRVINPRFVRKTVGDQMEETMKYVIIGGKSEVILDDDRLAALVGLGVIAQVNRVVNQVEVLSAPRGL